MIDPIHLLCVNAATLAGCFFLLWLLSLAIRDVSFVDSAWGFGIGALGIMAFLEASEHGPRQWLMVALVAIWSLRLGTYIFWRWRRHGADPRYEKIIADRKSKGWSFALTSGVIVFGFQSILLFASSLPQQLSQWDGDGTIGALSVVGTVIAITGFLFEAIGDWQLTRFRSDIANKGRVLDRGLWRYTRHPNYFGEACFWWGIFLIAAQTRLGLFSIVTPVLVTWLVARFSGVPLLEERMAKKPAQAAYIARTSAFIPWFPKKSP